MASARPGNVKSPNAMTTTIWSILTVYGVKLITMSTAVHMDMPVANISRAKTVNASAMMAINSVQLTAHRSVEIFKWIVVIVENADMSVITATHVLKVFVLAKQIVVTITLTQDLILETVAHVITNAPMV